MTDLLEQNGHFRYINVTIRPSEEFEVRLAFGLLYFDDSNLRREFFSWSPVFVGLYCNVETCGVGSGSSQDWQGASKDSAANDMTDRVRFAPRRSRYRLLCGYFTAFLK